MQQECKYFTAGHCGRGRTCMYSHNGTGSASSKSAALSRRFNPSRGPRGAPGLTSAPSYLLSKQEQIDPTKIPVVCKFFLSGNCKRGPGCQYLHIFVKKPASRKTASSELVNVAFSLDGTQYRIDVQRSSSIYSIKGIIAGYANLSVSKFTLLDDKGEKIGPSKRLIGDNIKFQVSKLGDRQYSFQFNADEVLFKELPNPSLASPVLIPTRENVDFLVGLDVHFLRSLPELDPKCFNDPYLLFYLPSTLQELEYKVSQNLFSQTDYQTIKEWVGVEYLSTYTCSHFDQILAMFLLYFSSNLSGFHMFQDTFNKDEKNETLPVIPFTYEQFETKYEANAQMELSEFISFIEWADCVRRMELFLPSHPSRRLIYLTKNPHITSIRLASNVLDRYFDKAFITRIFIGEDLESLSQLDLERNPILDPLPIPVATMKEVAPASSSRKKRFRSGTDNKNQERLQQARHFRKQHARLIQERLRFAPGFGSGGSGVGGRGFQPSFGGGYGTPGQPMGVGVTGWSEGRGRYQGLKDFDIRRSQYE